VNVETTYGQYNFLCFNTINMHILLLIVVPIDKLNHKDGCSGHA
jgi:hypothetical protein